ncbi:uncharacterized protein sip2 isoform X1 [Drosophila virilis]|uniref:Uncharacterized protein, isoform A n=2 Tax=Drosophila virilis TaxID=7244 RepID=B4LRF2_DROVI|nr:uncharacterized protein LOC6627295 isoform X2 [Drosophila virilis]EDW64622.1 uncharacterized protein Dvir_GJ21452, isoform A [Drosophila virilis]
MSGLEKFQDTPAWRQKLLKHLLLDRPAPAAPKPQRESMERRHSLDIVLDFKALMQARKAQLEDRQQHENHTTSSAISLSVKTETMLHVLNETQQQNADESFDALERMCDKTGSDPDSTLFQYLNSDDKEKVLALAKERSTRADNASDMEMSALRRMLDDVGDQDQLCNESPLKSAECTQLEDIEAPSRLWDNDFTINGNESAFQQTAQTSPVKMVGLLRPSTILEANEADLTGLQSDESSSHNSSSFLTAHTLKTAQSSETIASGSSCYETAGDNSLASSSKEATTLSVDDLFYAAIAKAKPHGMSKGEQQELLGDLHETLMDLAVNDAADSTIIELSSSGEEEEEDEDQVVKEGNDLNADIKQEESSLIDSEAEEEDKENKSIHLNGTMEEMEYMMQKAREYMAAKETSPSPSPAKATSDPDVIHLHKKLPKQNTFLMTPQKGASSPLHQGTSSRLPTGPCKSRYAINMDPPKTKFFKQPSAIPMRRELKVQRDHFAHIVSPIRTYTQKSGTAPLMSMFREKPNINDVFNKMSIKELEEESRLCQLKRGQTVASGNCNLSKLTPGCIDPAARLLPKKAYISSELKQVVDERTPMPMPNVPKIQKYLDSAVEPTVLRHDGKMKMPAQSNSSRNTSHIPRRPNQSLADLSLASGDISLYTLKDAQKF